MREILFKAKRKNWRELPKEEWWVEGYPVKYQPHASIEAYVYGIVPIYASALYIIEIDPETFCQDTGLKDKDGQKIFENDILKGYDYPYLSSGNFNYYAIVCWSDEGKYFCLYTVKNPESKVRGISEGNTELFEEFDYEKWEVIGNEIDNPELLERS